MAAKAIKATNYSSMPQTAAALSDAKQKMIVLLISILAYINSSTGDFVHDDIMRIGSSNSLHYVKDFYIEPPRNMAYYVAGKTLSFHEISS